MDREILYRGKRLDNGEWVEGDRVEQNNPEYHDYIITEFAADVDNRHIDILTCDIYEVDPSTVGRYTGLKDRNGKRIFEGDIVDVVCSGDETWRCVVSDIRNIPAEMCGSHVKSMEVIGNIHDNPEMLRGE